MTNPDDLRPFTTSGSEVGALILLRQFQVLFHRLAQF
jgi:hypothetical protein